MAIYGDYLNRNMTFQQLADERKVQLSRISVARGGRAILAYMADINKGNAPISLGYDDLLPVNDQLANLSGESIDVILETPGGSGEVAEDIVRALHHKFKEVAFIIPGWAKSAGTIMAMAGDEILMEPSSSLGPIDAQLTRQGKVFSADALLEGMEKIKDEVLSSGALNPAYIPILQGLSPGELQSAENAQKFSKALVSDWLEKYKFKDWEVHSSDGRPVTPDEKRRRAEEIASELFDHRKWLTHGRSIKIDNFVSMKLRVTDYSQNTELADAIRRYYTLTQMTFALNIFKCIETPYSQIYRFTGVEVAAPPSQAPGHVIIDAQCGNCQRVSRIQANLEVGQIIQPSFLPYPVGDKMPCPGCGSEINLTDIRNKIEAQFRKPIVI